MDVIVMLLHTFPRMKGTGLMLNPEKACSLDMEKLRTIESMILEQKESFTVEISGSMKQS